MQKIEYQNYLALGRTGKSSWIRYLAGSILIIGSACFAQILALLFLLVFNGLKPILDTKTNSLTIDPNVFFIVVESSFIIWFCSIWLVLRFILGRSLLSLITTFNQLNSARIFRAAKILICIYLVEAGITWIISPQAYQWNFNLQGFLFLLPAALVLTPIQSLTEELFFRGYLMQGLSPLFKNKWVLSLIVSVPFALGHIEWSQPLHLQLYVAASTCVFAIMLCLVTIRTNSLETAIGAHTANNLFVALFINSPDPFLKTSALLRHSMLDPWLEFGLDLLSALAFYFLAVKSADK